MSLLQKMFVIFTYFIVPRAFISLSFFIQGSSECTSFQHSLLHTITCIQYNCDPLPTSRLLKESATVSQWTGGPMVSSAMKWSRDRWAQLLHSLLNKTWYTERGVQVWIYPLVFHTFSLHSVVRMRTSCLTPSATPKSPTPDFWTHTLSTSLIGYSSTSHSRPLVHMHRTQGLGMRLTVSLFKYHAWICSDLNCVLN